MDLYTAYSFINEKLIKIIKYFLNFLIILFYLFS
jgi:hypothetical protein